MRVSHTSLLIVAGACLAAGCAGVPRASNSTPIPLSGGQAEGVDWSDDTQVTIRGQQTGGWNDPHMPGSTSQPRQPMPAGGAPYSAPAASPYPSSDTNNTHAQAPPAGAYQQVQYQQPGPGGQPLFAAPPPGAAPGFGQPVFTQPGAVPQAPLPPPGVPYQGPEIIGPGQLPPGWDGGPAPGSLLSPQLPTADLDVVLRETQTGRFMFGVGVNSDAGLTGQVVIDERNFDWRAFPTTFEDVLNGTAFRGGGQGFRLEAVPGSLLQRYMVSFTEPFLFNTPISLQLSGFYFDRRYFDWDENRLGGRVSFGYGLTHDLSVSLALGAERVKLTNPRVPGVPDLDDALGSSELYTSRFTVRHDTRDIPFAPTQGHLLELSYEQGFGTYTFPRGEANYRQYHLLHQRPDGSGRHTLGFTYRVGVTGANTPIYEHFFAGGHTTLRGFEFRGASPKVSDVTVGGEFLFVGSVEYIFPISADDMFKGVVFVDYGTVEEKIDIDWNDFRVAPGLGLRISVPALGPAPIALDFAFPVALADTDDEQVFSFFVGVGR